MFLRCFSSAGGASSDDPELEVVSDDPGTEKRTVAVNIASIVFTVLILLRRYEYAGDLRTIFGFVRVI